jgi:hypothetical protein
VKFDLLIAMTVKVLTSPMWKFCLHFQGKNKVKKALLFSSETLVYFTDLRGKKLQKTIHFSYPCAVFYTGFAPAAFRATKTATSRT